MGIQISQQVRAARPGPATESVAETVAENVVEIIGGNFIETVTGIISEIFVEADDETIA